MADQHTESDFCACRLCCQWRERLHDVTRERDEALAEVNEWRCANREKISTIAALEHHVADLTRERDEAVKALEQDRAWWRDQRDGWNEELDAERADVDRLRALLREARVWLLEIGNDYPGSTAQRWCLDKAAQIAEALEGRDG